MPMDPRVVRPVLLAVSASTPAIEVQTRLSEPPAMVRDWVVGACRLSVPVPFCTVTVPAVSRSMVESPAREGMVRLLGPPVSVRRSTTSEPPPESRVRLVPAALLIPPTIRMPFPETAWERIPVPPARDRGAPLLVR